MHDLYPRPATCITITLHDIVYVVTIIHSFSLAVPDDAPSNLEAAVVTARTCLLTWVIPSVPNGILISHTITYNLTSGGGGLARVTTGGRETSYLITGLHPYEYYRFTVYASTRIGSSPVSTVSIRTEEASEQL